MWRRILLDEHKRQALQKMRPACRGDREFEAAIEETVSRLGTCWIIYCRRQVIEGTNLMDIIEAWLYIPGVGSWPVSEYRGEPARPIARL